MNIKDTDLPFLLRCDAAEGEVYWLPRKPHWFITARDCRAWNTMHAHKKALNSLNKHGYYVGTIYGVRFQKHRVIWFLTYGYWPKEIDHIDGNRSNNKIVNLRDVTPQENQRNKSMNQNNTSGQMGVGIHKASGLFRAFITVNKKQVSLGYFNSYEEAVSARLAAESRYGFHVNHGRRP